MTTPAPADDGTIILLLIQASDKMAESPLTIANAHQ
jgi:hypothetical protein